MNNLVFSDSYLYKTGERIVPGSVTFAAFIEHWQRYLFATKYCKYKIVLNVASGSGYGSIALLKQAKEVFNVDISELSVAYGNKYYGAYNNHFIQLDAERLKFPANFFDVVVSFETIEHLPHPKRFISDCYRVLKKGGRLILSSPNKSITAPYTDRPANKFHLHEWNFDGIKKLLIQKFKIENLYGQNYRKRPALKDNSLRLKTNLVGRAAELMPGVLMRIIKKYLWKYPNIDLFKIKASRENLIFKVKENEFTPDKKGYAYSIIILCLQKE